MESPKPRPEPDSSTARRGRALRASAAVALCGASACTGAAESTGARDLYSTADPSLFVDAEAPQGTPPPRLNLPAQGVLTPVEDADVPLAPVDACLAERDGVCPAGCDRNTDADCCEDQDTGPGMWCTYDAHSGCMCAVEGPFSPPGGR